MIDFILTILFGPGGGEYAIAWVLPAIMAASSIGNLFLGARSQNRADQNMRRAQQLGERRYREAAPFREGALQAFQRLPQLQRPDLTGIFADPSNPFARPIRPLTDERQPREGA